MTKQFLLLISILLIAGFTAQAQFQPMVFTEMIGPSTRLSVRTNISPLVRIRFQESYPNVADARWSETATGYLVNFSSNEINYHVFLDKKGAMTSQIRYYHEKEMPVNVRNQINHLNGCFTIGMIKEVTTVGGTAYLVTILGADYWKVMRIVGYEMDVFEEHHQG